VLAAITAVPFPTMFREWWYAASVASGEPTSGTGPASKAARAYLGPVGDVASATYEATRPTARSHIAFARSASRLSA
jgi:hypothetical protein